MRLRIRRKIIMAILIFAGFGISLCFSQESKSKREVVPYYPGNGDENSVIKDREFQSIQKSVEKEIFEKARILATIAFREKDKEMCNKLNYKFVIDDCKEKYDTFLFLECIAKGQCSKIAKIRPRYSNFKEICKAMHKRDCSSLPQGYKRMLCEAFLKRDKNLYREAINNEKFISQDGGSKDRDNYEAIDLYYGFKTKIGEEVCDSYSSEEPFIKKLACQFLFCKNTDRFKERLMKDLSYFEYVKRYKKGKNICENIKDPTIKKACYNSEIIDLRDFLSR